jgi:hypothetical protein
MTSKKTKLILILYFLLLILNYKIQFPKRIIDLANSNFGTGKGKIKRKRQKYGGGDIFLEWVKFKNNFYYKIYMSVEEFEEILSKLKEPEDTKIHELSFKNKDLLAFYFMAQYPTYYSIAMEFKISICSISKIIYEITPILYSFF